MLKRIPFAEHPTIWQGLQACYNLQEQTGTAVRSIYGTREGTSTTDIRYLTDTGRLRKAFNFDGYLSDHIDFTGKLEKTVGEFIAAAKPFSFGFWCKPKTLSSFGIILSSTTTSATAGFLLGSSDAKFQMSWFSSPSGTNWSRFVTDSDVFTTNKWVHVIITYDATSVVTGWTLLFDGVSKPYTRTENYGTLVDFQSPTKSFKTGYNQPSLQWDGYMEQLCIWNREITAPEASWLAEGHVADLSYKELS